MNIYKLKFRYLRYIDKNWISLDIYEQNIILYYFGWMAKLGEAKKGGEKNKVCTMDKIFLSKG